MDLTHVLVVDDNHLLRQMLRLVLEDAGYTVTQAGDGHEALTHLRASRSPHIVLLDVEMPRLDGVGVLRTVATDLLLSTHHAYVLVTANSQRLFSASVLDIISRLSVPVVQKPVRAPTLLREVAYAQALLKQRLRENDGKKRP